MGLKRSLAVISTTAILAGSALFSSKTQAQYPYIGTKKNDKNSINITNTVMPPNLESMIRERYIGMILIDPGHDEKNIGCNTNGIREDSLNLVLSKKIAKLLQDEGYKVFLTRDSTIGINTNSMDLNDDGKIDSRDEAVARANYIKEMNPDYAIVIHHNASHKGKKPHLKPNPKSNGTELFFSGLISEKQLDNLGTDYNLPNSCMYLYSESLRSFAEALGQYMTDNGINTRVFGSDMKILVENPDNTLYLEVGYMTNPSELERIISPEWQAKFSTIIAEFFRMRKDSIQASSATYTADSFIENKEYFRMINTSLISEYFKETVGQLRRPITEFTPLTKSKKKA